jgi:hypothetical protein
MPPFFTPANLRLVMGLSFFVVGLLATVSGLLLLIVGPYRKEAEALAAHTARIGAKALTDNITTVAQSATALIDAMNNLIRTSSGNAIVLIAVGAGFEVAAYYLLIVTAQ